MKIGESFLDVCKREVKEETGLEIDGIRKLHFTNDDFGENEGLHYVTLYFEANWLIGTQTANIMEPDTTEDMGWFDPNDLPEPVWLPLKKMIEQGGLK